MSGVRLACDEPACDALYPVQPVEGGYHIYEQRATIRSAAAESGWTINEQGDWCPEHGG